MTQREVAQAYVFEQLQRVGYDRPGMASVQDTTHITSQTTLPLNLMLLPNMPAIQSLFAAGARRFTAGPATFQTAYGHAQTLAHALLTDHSVAGLFTNSVGYDLMNGLLNEG